VDNQAKPFGEWIGRRSESEDIVSERMARSYRAILQPFLADVPEGAAPLGLHWCLSPAIAAMSELGPDGHPAKNRDLPPIPLPRRMWAGGAIETLEPLRIGDRVRRVTTIADIVRKQGRSGELWFVAVDHEYLTDRGPALRERHDIVYRELPKAARIEAARPDGDRLARPRRASQCWVVETSPTLLFRYSAITFNGHRIHYDWPYATTVEGYEGLVVHGPLQATLMFNLAAARRGAAPPKFEYRGLSPAFAGQPLSVCASSLEEDVYWTEGPSGQTHMEGRATGS